MSKKNICAKPADSAARRGLDVAATRIAAPARQPIVAGIGGPLRPGGAGSMAVDAVSQNRSPTDKFIDDEGDVDEALPSRDVGVSRPNEFHFRPLAEPDVSPSMGACGRWCSTRTNARR